MTVEWRLFGRKASAQVLLGPTPFCRRDTAIQNCFSNTMIPSTSPLGVLRWLALVSVLPSAEGVYLARTLNSSAFPSTINASPSHFAVALTEPVRYGRFIVVSFPSVVYFTSRVRSPSTPVIVIDSEKLGSLCSILETTSRIFSMAGNMAGNLLFSRFIFQTPLKSGFVCAAMIEEQK